MHAHGGLQFETTDVHAIFEAKDVSIEHANEVHSLLSEKAKYIIETEIAKIEGAVQDPVSKEKGKGLSKKSFEKIMPLFNDITMASSLAELKKVRSQLRTAKEKGTYSTKQYNHLARHYKQRRKQLKNK